MSFCMSMTRSAVCAGSRTRASDIPTQDPLDAMFESAELNHSVDKKTYDRAEPKLREEPLELQSAVLEAKRFPVLIIIGGVDGAGKGETVNLLNEWMDPRHIETHAFGDASDEERERPAIWRFWRAL